MSKLTLGLKRGIIEENPTFVQVLGNVPHAGDDDLRY